MAFRQLSFVLDPVWPQTKAQCLPILGTRPRHLKLLVRPAHQDPRRHPGPADVPDDPFAAVVANVGIGRFVEREPQAGDLPGDGAAQPRALLADAAGEDERVGPPAERDEVGADEAADAVDEEVEREALGFGVLAAPLVGVGLVVGLVILGGGGGDEAKVGGPCQGPPAGLFVEDLLGSRDVERLGGAGRELPGVACVVEHEAEDRWGWWFSQ
ncbi:hypothetical protein VTK26DRAFT_3417 [Humicola hyalothermophila]